ncbi:MAG: tyrosine recombinase XerC [Thiohalorhabdus sp.]|uniref:site-specific integrase n=1 Tax=Thiohalorhabdus sp. TaxID=3094134 RepID=UPI003980B3AF
MQDRQTFRRYLTPAEERQLLNTVGQFKDLRAQRDHAWLRLLRQTGIRVGGLARLTVDDARRALRERELYVRGKGGRHYRVATNRKARQALQDLLRIRKELGHPERPDDALVMSRKGRGLSVRSYQDRLKHWREVAGLQEAVSPHWLRHTLAKRLIKQSTAEQPLLIVQRALGHTALTSTAIYTQPDKEDMAQAMEEAS